MEALPLSSYVLCPFRTSIFDRRDRWKDIHGAQIAKMTGEPGQGDWGGAELSITERAPELAKWSRCSHACLPKTPVEVQSSC